MARLQRYRPNRAGIRDLAHSQGVENVLVGRAEAVRQVAQASYDARPPHTGEVDVDVLTDSDSDRARVAVIARHPAALRIEADRRPLGGALDAAGTG